jgi:hypothetical protein
VVFNGFPRNGDPKSLAPFTGTQVEQFMMTNYFLRIRGRRDL